MTLLLRTLLSHYRRHPFQAVFLLAGIVIANVLLVGTLLINAQARASYAEGERVLGARPVAWIEPVDGVSPIDEAEYIRLRREGFDMLAPWLRRFVVTRGGEPVEVAGVDGFAMPRPVDADGRLSGRSGEFAFPPYATWGAPARLAQLGWAEGEEPLLASGERLPALVAAEGQGLGHRLVMDIGALQQLTGSAGALSAIMVFDAPPQQLAALDAALPAALERVPAPEPLDQRRLTASFHLNLAAMGLLAFVVGIFLTYNAVAFSYTDRLELLRRLKLAGVTRGELGRALLGELLLFVAAGLGLGYVLGSALAAALLPGVGTTLAQLYGVYIGYPERMLLGGLWLPLAMTGIAIVLAALFPLREALRAPPLSKHAEGWRVDEVARRDAVLLAFGLALLAACAVLSRVAASLPVALAAMAALLLGAALCLPAALRAALALLRRAVPHARPLARWLVADTRWLLGPAALALMAMTLALVANSGLNTMIGSFRAATDDWLGQRLVADLYLRSEVPAGALRAWLDENAPGAGVAERYAVDIDLPTPRGSAPVELYSLPLEGPFPGSVTPMRGGPGAMEAFLAGEGVLVSERAWRLDGIEVGSAVPACPGREPLPVLGVYRDYGNPVSQWMLAEPLFRTCWPARTADSMGIYGPAGVDWDAVTTALAREFGLGERELVDQRTLRAAGMAVFDRTFTVTQALNALTLLVAAIGIFCAVSAIHHHRIRQQALLTSLGVTGRERVTLQLAQWGLLGLFCTVLVWPFGAALAGVLAGVVTPVAFGWSFALRPDWAHYPGLVALAFACLLAATAWPVLRLMRAEPGVLLKEAGP